MLDPFKRLIAPCVFLLVCLIGGNGFAKTAQELRAQMIPYNERFEEYDYYEGLIVGDEAVRINRCSRSHCEPTTRKLAIGEIVSIHLNYSAFAQAGYLRKKFSESGYTETETRERISRYQKLGTTVPLFYVTGWAIGEDSDQVEGFIPHSSVKILSNNEYKSIYEQKYPEYRRKADAIKRVRFFKEPARGQKRFSRHEIGPENEFGGDKNFEVLRRTTDSKWYLVQYWTGDVGGYRKGWVPANSIEIHLTEEEKKQQSLERKQKEMAAIAKEQVERQIAEEKARIKAELASKERTIISKGGTDLFEADSPFSPVLTHLPYKTLVEIVTDGDLYIKVKIDDLEGFIDSDAVEKVDWTVQPAKR